MITTVHSSIRSDKPPADVNAVLLDPDKATLWTTDLEDYEIGSKPPETFGHVRSRKNLISTQPADIIQPLDTIPGKLGSHWRRHGSPLPLKIACNRTKSHS
jgi:hypothetical protein